MRPIIVLLVPSVSMPDATSLSIIPDVAMVYDISKYATYSDFPPSSVTR